MADESTTPATDQAATKSTAAKNAGAKKPTGTKAATKRAPAKKAPAKKSARKSPAKKSPAKKTAAKKSSTKKAASKTTAKKTAKKTAGLRASARSTKTTKSVARKSANLTATQRVTETVRDTTAGAAATGRTVVAKAAAAAQKPVETGRAMVGTAGERAAGLGRAVLTPSAQFLTAAQTRAKELAADPAALRGLADKALRSKSGRSGPLAEVGDEFKTLGRLVAAYARGDYRDIPLDSLLTVIAGLVYVASPLDLVPESVPIAGYADDAVAVGFVIRQVHHELSAFREWEAKQPATKKR